MSDATTENKIFGALSYLGVLVVIPLLLARDSKFVRFHINQGLTLFIVDIVYGCINKILLKTICRLPLIGALIGFCLSLIGFVILIFVIIGIINVIQGKEKELPVIGSVRLLK